MDVNSDRQCRDELPQQAQPPMADPETLQLDPIAPFSTWLDPTELNMQDMSSYYPNQMFAWNMWSLNAQNNGLSTQYNNSHLWGGDNWALSKINPNRQSLARHGSVPQDIPSTAIDNATHIHIPRTSDSSSLSRTLRTDLLSDVPFPGHNVSIGLHAAPVEADWLETGLPTPTEPDHASSSASMKLTEFIENCSERQSRVPCKWLLEEAVMIKLQNATSTLPLMEHSTLPTKTKCQRYLRCYFQYFQVHLPLLHSPTFCPEGAPHTLLLAILAIGALYAFDHKEAKTLYMTAKAVFTIEQKNMPHTQRLQALLLLASFSCWSEDTDLRISGIYYHSKLSEVRERLGLSSQKLW